MSTLGFYFSLLIGLAIGSFLNVVILRLPIILQNEWRQMAQEYLTIPSQIHSSKFNLIFPNSHCQHCQTKLTWFMNIPLVSYFFLKGKCYFCHHPLSKQYPLVEFFTALITLYVFYQFGFSVQTVAAWLFTWTLIALAVIDFNTYLLPDRLTLGLLWVGLLISVKTIFISSEAAILAAIFGYSFFAIVAFIFQLIRKKPGMGQGDFKLLAAIGAWVGLLPLIHVIALAAVGAAIVNLVLLLTKKIKYNQMIPFGPALCCAGWVVFMFEPSFKM